MKLIRLAKFLDRMLARVRSRECDFAIGGREDTYLARWWVLPRNKFFNIYHHEIRRDDDDRALHDHPWWSISFVINGQMKECLPNGKSRNLTVGSIVSRSAESLHRLELVDGAYCRTIFITGRRIREWGFQCPQGWRHWKVFTSFDETGDSTTVGRGCGED